MTNRCAVDPGCGKAAFYRKVSFKSNPPPSEKARKTVCKPCAAASSRRRGKGKKRRQNNPEILPSAATSMRSAAGILGRSGMVMISPVSATINPASAEILRLRTVMEHPSGAPSNLGLLEKLYASWPRKREGFHTPVPQSAWPAFRRAGPFHSHAAIDPARDRLELFLDGEGILVTEAEGIFPSHSQTISSANRKDKYGNKPGNGLFQFSSLRTLPNLYRDSDFNSSLILCRHYIVKSLTFQEKTI